MSSYRKVKVVLVLETSKPKDDALFQLMNGLVTLLRASNYYKGIKYRHGYIKEEYIEKDIEMSRSEDTGDNLDKPDKTNSTQPTADTLCTCPFPFVSEYAMGVCDRCGGQYFDTRMLLPLQVMRPPEPSGDTTPRVLATDYNEQAIKINNRLAKNRLKELKELEQTKEKS